MTVLPEHNVAGKLEGEDASHALAAEITTRLAAIQRNFEALERLFALNPVAATDAADNAVFVDEADGIYKFKDAAGVAHPLY